MHGLATSEASPWVMIHYAAPEQRAIDLPGPEGRQRVGTSVEIGG
jgi:hypothetical protein